MPELELRLFGHGVVLHAGVVVPLATKKALGLLAYLALSGRTTRQHLAGLFWAEMPESAARNNLRKELFRLRETVLAPVLEVSPDAVALNLESDVQRFWHNSQDESALELGYGELLQGYSPPSEEFAVWLAAERERLHQAITRLYATRAARLEAEGDLRGALSDQLALVHLDSLQEVHHREVMRLHWLLGERSAALERFDTLERVLKQELGLKPLPESFLLLEQIQKAIPSLAVAVPTKPSWRLQRPPLVGRESAWTWLSSNPAPFKLIVGEVGIGKSRLCEDFLGTQGQCVRLSGFATAKTTPYYPIAEHLRWCLQTQHLEPSRLEPAQRQELARLVPEFSNEVSPFSSSDGRNRLITALAQVFVPHQVLFLDDLHLFDASSLELLAHLMRHGHRAIATVRELELAENPPALELITALERDRNVARLALLPLQLSHTQQLLQTLSGRNAKLFATRLHTASGGNPLLLFETLYGLFEQGTLTLEPDGTWGSQFDTQTEDYTELPIPSNVQELVLGRVRHLGAAVRRILEVATLCAEPFAADDVLTSSALSETEAVSALERTVVAQLLRRESNHYRFAHDVVRRVLLEELTPERKHLIHRRLAGQLQRTSGDPSRIAHHLEECGQGREAIVFWQKAGLAARAVFAHTEARAFFERGFSAQPNAALAFELHSNLADLELTQSNLDALEQHAETMQNLSHALGLEYGVRANLLSAKAKLYRGQYGLALELAQDALPDAQGERKAEVLLMLGTAQIGLGQLENAKQHLLDGLAVQKRGAVAAELHSSLKEVFRQMGEISNSLVQSRQAYKVYKVLGQQEQELSELAQYGQLLCASGNSGEGLSVLQSVVNRSRQLAFDRVLSVALIILVSDLVKLGRFKDVLSPIEEGLKLTHQKMQAREVQFLSMRSKAYFRLGQLGTALVQGQMALQKSRTLGVQHTVQQLWCAEMYLSLGMRDAAQPYLEYAEANLTRNQEHWQLLKILQVSADFLPIDSLDSLQISRVEFQVKAACLYAQHHVEQPAKAIWYLDQLPKTLPQWLDLQVNTWRILLGQDVRPKNLIKNAPSSIELLYFSQVCGLECSSITEALVASLAEFFQEQTVRLEINKFLQRFLLPKLVVSLE
jgi:DNA-binding SARP family transcriptional activator/tetratricopeptide (TPR) repeat protein